MPWSRDQPDTTLHAPAVNGAGQADPFAWVPGESYGAIRFGAPWPCRVPLALPEDPPDDIEIIDGDVEFDLPGRDVRVYMKSMRVSHFSLGDSLRYRGIELMRMPGKHLREVVPGAWAEPVSMADETVRLDSDDLGITVWLDGPSPDDNRVEDVNLFTPGPRGWVPGYSVMGISFGAPLEDLGHLPLRRMRAHFPDDPPEFQVTDRSLRFYVSGTLPVVSEFSTSNSLKLGRFEIVGQPWGLVRGRLDDSVGGIPGGEWCADGEGMIRNSALDMVVYLDTEALHGGQAEDDVRVDSVSIRRGNFPPAELLDDLRAR